MTLAPSYRLRPEDGREVRTRRERGAESAVTRYRCLATAAACSLLELQPITGELSPALQSFPCSSADMKSFWG